MMLVHRRCIEKWAMMIGPKVRSYRRAPVLESLEERIMLSDLSGVLHSVSASPIWVGPPGGVAGVTPSADLSLTLVASSSSVVVGQTLTYTLSVANMGPDNATGVILTDMRPNGLALVSASSPPGAAQIQSDGSLIVQLGTLAD